jgi:O-antigen/teichoic acid export membrane protein
MLPASYHGGAALLPILVIAFLAQAAYTVTGPEIYYSKKTWLVPVVAYSAAAVDVAVSVLTAPYYGAIGVAWGLAARWVMTAALAGFFSLRLVKIPHAWFSYLRIAICGLLSAAMFHWRPMHSIFADLAWGTLALCFYPAFLLAGGDPTIREAWALLTRIVGRLRR